MTTAPALPPESRTVVDWTDPRAEPIPGYAVRADGTVLGWRARGESKRGRLCSGSPPPPPRGDGHPRAVLTAADVPEVRRLYRAGVAYKEIADRYEVAEETVRYVLTGKTWGHVPDPLGPVVMRRKGPDAAEANRSLLDWDKAREIRRLRAAGVSTAELASRYGVARITVQQLLKGRTWRE